MGTELYNAGYGIGRIIGSALCIIVPVVIACIVAYVIIRKSRAKSIGSK